MSVNTRSCHFPLQGSALWQENSFLMHYPPKHMPDVLLDSHIVCKQQYSCHLKLRYYFSLASIAVVFEWEELKRGHITFFFFFKYKTHFSHPKNLQACYIFSTKVRPKRADRMRGRGSTSAIISSQLSGQGWKRATKLCSQNNLTRDLKSLCCSFAGWKMHKSCEVWIFLWDTRNEAQVVQTPRRPNSSQSIISRNFCPSPARWPQASCKTLRARVLMWFWQWDTSPTKAKHLCLPSWAARCHLWSTALPCWQRGREGMINQQDEKSTLAQIQQRLIRSGCLPWHCLSAPISKGFSLLKTF